MHSPARKHYQRVTAAKAAGDAAPGQSQTGEQYELHAAALWEARQALKGIKSVEAKIARKRELLPQFAPYVDGVLSAGTGAQDDVLVTVMLWRLDVGDIAGALAIAEYAIKHGLDTPDRFERDTASLVAEQVAEEALKQLQTTRGEGDDSDNSEAAAHLVMHLVTAEALTRDADMHDQVRAKLHKALGYAYRDKGNSIDEALKHLRRALELNDKVGVKKDIEQLERQAKQQNAGGQANT
ncbi:phage terminase small subunit [Halomonas binhaiensis]|uniref:Terminase n=1 Tax=Halomonas binhaiensis TaxID=2562282 RepID=A0A5C1ND91_9GAMM|nr:phage terminase small subunit [Halomonas binhaiensis]QEM80225.1 terminase [Halomonas binhaiensis]